MVAFKSRYALSRPVFEEQAKLLLVVAPYYKEITDALIVGAQSEISAINAVSEIIEVPGALEIPTAIAMADKQSDFDGYIALGCVIRGETTHYDAVCCNSNQAIQFLGLRGLCIGNGILNVENHQQALKRANPALGNKGAAAAAAALHLIYLRIKLRKSTNAVGFRTREDGITSEKSASSDRK
ncbi:MAG: 6,7-dimethyl-8-ribityllumazine synthase [Aestuariivita sp.]|nr:6,7-dimethyl-8-ribityllumazine synthase [Aestuariivita sp.]